MSPNRLNKDPVVRTVEDLDRSRRWVVFLAIVLTVQIVAVVVLGLAFRDLSHYIRQPAGRDNRIKYQCQVERKLGLAEVDCRG